MLQVLFFVGVLGEYRLLCISRPELTAATNGTQLAPLVSLTYLTFWRADI